MKIKPAPGLKVRDPYRRDLLPDTGRNVPDHDPIWLRLLRDGDVVVMRQPALQVEATRPEAPEKPGPVSDAAPDADPRLGPAPARRAPDAPASV